MSEIIIHNVSGTDSKKCIITTSSNNESKNNCVFSNTANSSSEVGDSFTFITNTNDSKPIIFYSAPASQQVLCTGTGSNTIFATGTGKAITTTGSKNSDDNNGPVYTEGSDDYNKAKAIAILVHAACDGDGRTDEDALKQYLTGLNSVEADTVKQAYKDVFGEDIEELIESETSGDTEESLLSALKGETDSEDNQSAFENSLEDLWAQAFYEAGEKNGGGTDESATIALLNMLTSHDNNLTYDKANAACKNLASSDFKDKDDPIKEAVIDENDTIPGRFCEWTDAGKVMDVFNAITDDIKESKTEYLKVRNIEETIKQQLRGSGINTSNFKESTLPENSIYNKYYTCGDYRIGLKLDDNGNIEKLDMFDKNGYMVNANIKTITEAIKLDERAMVSNNCSTDKIEQSSIAAKNTINIIKTYLTNYLKENRNIDVSDIAITSSDSTTYMKGFSCSSGTIEVQFSSYFNSIQKIVIKDKDGKVVDTITISHTAAGSGSGGGTQTNEKM